MPVIQDSKGPARVIVVERRGAVAVRDPRTPVVAVAKPNPVEAIRADTRAVEAGRELVQEAVEAGETFSFRVGELHAWMLAAMARRDRRLRQAAEVRMAAIEQRLGALENGAAAQP